VISLFLPAIRFGMPFGGPEIHIGFVAWIGSPVFALFSIVGIGYGFLRAAFFGGVALLANIMVIASLPLFRQLGDGRNRRWLPAIFALGLLVWFFPRNGHASKCPELRGGYMVWTAAISTISGGLMLAAIAHRMRNPSVRSNPVRYPRAR
jgi:hypothetical protein